MKMTIKISIAKWRLSTPNIQELPLLAVSSLRLLSWLANPGNLAMSSHAEGKNGTWAVWYIQPKQARVGGGGATQKPFSIAERRYNEHAICMWTEDRSLHRLTNISSKHVLAYAQRNTAKRTDPSAPQKHRWAWGNTNIGECTGACA